jgi:hypothetical protein
MEMDWKSNASRDFSLVVWSTGSNPVQITANLDATDDNQSHWPLTTRLDDDQNAAQENGADLCSENP